MVLLSSCATASVQSDALAVADVVDGYKMELRSQDGQCVVYLNGQRQERLVMSLEAPCFFLRQKNGSIKTYRYEDIRTTVIIVAGTKPVPDAGSYPRPQSLRVDCGRESQAIMIQSEYVKLSSRIAKDIIYCTESAADEKEYWQFSH